MRAAVYCRISDDRERGTPDEGLGIERQREDCLALVEREGWTLVDTFTDNSRSAFNGKERPAWKRLLTACADGAVDVIVAWNDDRLWRNVVEQQLTFGLLSEGGVERLVTVTGGRYEIDSTDFSLDAGVRALFAQAESVQKAKRVKRKLEQLAAAGRWRGGPRPFGYRSPTEEEVRDGAAEDGGLVMVPEEGEVVRELAHRTLGGESLTALTRDLNERGVPSATGGTWRTQTLRGMLTNPIYAGLNRFRGEVIGEGRWPAILDPETHEGLVAMIETRKRGPGAQPRRLLTGTLRCYRCGHGMSSTVRRGDRRYCCRANKAEGACGGPSVSAEPAEDVVRRIILGALSDADEVARRLARAGEADVKALHAAVTADEERLNRLVADHYTGKVPERAYLNARAELEERIKTNRSAISEAATSTLASNVPWGSAEKLAEWWGGATVSQQRALVDAVVERVDLKPWDSSFGRTFDEGRIEVIWRQ